MFLCARHSGDEAAWPRDPGAGPRLTEGREPRTSMLNAKLGADAPAEIKTVYTVMIRLSSHSPSAMRDLLGSPNRMIAAEIKQGGTQITALFDYGNFTAIYECMIGDVVSFEAGFEINTRWAASPSSIRRPTSAICR